MSAGQEELMDEQEAGRYLNISPERLRGLAPQGEIRVVVIRTPDEIEPMYLRGEMLRLS